MYMVTVRPASIRQTVGVFVNFVNLQGLGDILLDRANEIKKYQKKIKRKKSYFLISSGHDMDPLSQM